MQTKFPFYPPDRRRELETWVAEYAFEQTEPTPWTPLRRPLSECRISLVTTAGLRLNRQLQFAADRRTGSAEYRELSVYLSPSDLAFDFTNYDPSAAIQDINSLVPLDRLREFTDEGRMAGITETFYSFFGLCSDTVLLRKNVRTVAARIKEQGSDVVLVLTANLVCNQTAGLIARELEREGLSTVVLATVREVIEQIHVPRTLFVNFPFGRPFGRPAAPAIQRAVLMEILKTLHDATRPGKVRDCPIAWNGPAD